ncbi:unnamed protein product [Clonostachys rosea]|uniref:Uncharacterized protein n=1 Tax=Bionectria ochroleuca TaxID=29856 RepID=A0ABY6UXE1_BIOOC|nr:unnamed protein product [Clonostachys rosea]
MTASHGSDMFLSFEELVKSTDEELVELILSHPWEPVGYWYCLTIRLDDNPRPPSRSELQQLADRLDRQRKAALATPLPITKVRHELARRLRRTRSSLGQLGTGEPQPFIGPETHPDHIYREREKAAYKLILELSGRPLCPIQRLVEISDSEPRSDASRMCRPWDRYLRSLLLVGRDSLKWWQTFSLQLKDWERFRIWQRDHRGPNHHDTYESFVQEIYRDSKIFFGEENYRNWCEDMEEDPMPLWRKWETREKNRDICREHDCDGFEGYCDAVRNRLESHGFTQSFQLHQDLLKQDPLSTWVEYVYYNYWRLDCHIMALDRKQQQMKEEWSKAQSGNLFGLGEGTTRAKERWYEDEKISLLFDFFDQSLTIEALKDQSESPTRVFQNTTAAVRDAEALFNLKQAERRQTSKEASRAVNTLNEVLAKNEKAKTDLLRASDRQKVFHNLLRYSSEAWQQAELRHWQQRIIDWAYGELRSVERETRELPGASSIPMNTTKLRRKRVEFTEAEPTIHYLSSRESETTNEDLDYDENEHRTKRLHLSLDRHPSSSGSLLGSSTGLSSEFACLVGEQAPAQGKYMQSAARVDAKEQAQKGWVNKKQSGKAKQLRATTAASKTRESQPLRRSPRFAGPQRASEANQGQP